MRTNVFNIFLFCKYPDNYFIYKKNILSNLLHFETFIRVYMTDRKEKFKKKFGSYIKVL